MILLRRLARFLQEGSLWVLLFLLPFSIAAIEISFVLLVVGWGWARLDPATRRQTVWIRREFRGLLAALTVFFAVCALSIAVSNHPDLSVKALFTKWLEYLLFLVMVTDVTSRPGVVERCLKILLASAAFVIVEAVTQEYRGWGLFRHHRLDYFGRMTGPYENPIDLATYLMVLIPVFLAYALLRQRSIVKTAVIWVVVAGMVICLARTESMGAWLAFGVGLLALSRQAAIRRWVILAATVLVMTSGFFVWRTGHMSELYSVSAVGKTDRWAMWQSALSMIRDRPMLGHGLNTFMANYLTYWVGGEQQPRYAHNCYLQVAAETGLIGLVAFLAVLGLTFRTWGRVLRRLPADSRLMLLGLVSGLLAFVVQAAIDTNFYSLRQAALFWTLSGVALGMTARVLAPAKTEGAGCR